MLDVWDIIILVVVEAYCVYTLATQNRPSKKNRKKLKEFARDNNLSEYAAINRILGVFFAAYENGLKEKMKEAYIKQGTPSYEEWKKSKDLEESPPKTKQIVKPIKKTRSR